MGITLEMVLGVVFLTLLGLLLTGPGMWSEKWGWGFLRRKGPREEPARGRDLPAARTRDDQRR